jgi:hypothetical protein
VGRTDGIYVFFKVFVVVCFLVLGFLIGFAVVGCEGADASDTDGNVFDQFVGDKCW